MATDLYSSHFGFSGRPFSLMPDPSCLFWSQSHRRAYSVLEYGILNHAQITVLTGEVGTGKTTLIRHLLNNLQNRAAIGLLSNVHGGRGDLLRWVLNALDVEVPRDADYVALFQAFQDHALDVFAAGGHVLLIFDEAQHLGADLLEELRMLTNLNSGQDMIVQLILVGQPELRDLITSPTMRQFAQRVSTTFHINPMSVETTRDYIAFRLKSAGGSGEEIPADVAFRIFEVSGGVPRIVNNVCDLCLSYAMADEADRVELATLEEVLSDGLVLAQVPDSTAAVTRGATPMVAPTRVVK